MAKKEEKVCNCLYLTYSEYTEGGEICEGDEDSSWPNHEDEYITWNLLKCLKNYSNKECLRQETVDIDFEAKVGTTVHIVYVRYGTGGTFGHTNGAWKIIGVYEHYGQAEKVKKSIEDNTYEGYICWIGHFETFESCDIETMTVE